jgi:CubicO group peptidase (beta-lactamase class C family)
MMKKTIIAVMLFVWLLSACAQAVAPTVSPEPPTAALPSPTSAQDPKALGAEFDALVQEKHQAGLYDGAVLVASDGQVLLSQGYGYADREKKIPNTPQTKFRIASMTKQFTAMAILLLQQQGKLSVEDSICKYIENCPEIFKPVKIRHLLSHSAGLPSTTLYSFPGDQMVSKSAKPFFQPGEQFMYQDVGYSMAGRIIETVSGQSYASFLKQSIFDPLGMSNTGVDDRKQTDMAKGYSKADGDIALLPMNGLFADGSIYSTVEDIYRWDQALYTEKLLPKSALKAMFSPQMAVPDGKYYSGFDGSKGWSYGFGWFIAPKELGYIIHGGTLPGYRAEFRRYMDAKITIILLANHEAVDLHNTAETFAKKLLGNRK